MLVTALSGLVNTISFSINRIFTKHTSDVLWFRDECVKFWCQKVKVQGHGGITSWYHHCTGGGIQYSTSHVELDFLVF